MATVYRAVDRVLHRPVALKLVRSDRRDDSYEQERLIREARAIAEVSHPNVVTVFEVGRCPEGVFIAMELIAGPTLKTWLRSTARPWGEVVRMALQTGRGLAAAHDRGITHGDFKPANVMIGDDDPPRVLDFGLAQIRAQRRSRGAEPRRGRESSAATSAHRLVLDESVDRTLTLDSRDDSDPVIGVGSSDGEVSAVAGEGDRRQDSTRTGGRIAAHL